MRVPSSEFLLALLRKSGPLATASAAKAGEPAILDNSTIKVRGFDVQGIFHTGQLTSSGASTVVSATETSIEVLREGAISLAQLGEVLPELLSSDS
ncbi:MAG: Sua5/YciO/YrdC/YwlC family protein [Actinomycetota bacterium]